MNIVIDKEFKSLIPPLTQDEYDGLKESILMDGCRDALILWGNILVDGHNRYEICMETGTPFQTFQRDFDDRNDAIAWIIKNQFGRRNLPAYERARLALKLKPLIAERANKNRIAGLKQNNSVCQKSDERIDTKKELARTAGVSHDTIAKVERIENEASDDIKQQLRSGDISINKAYQEITRPHVTNNSGNNEWYTPEKYINLAREVLLYFGDNKDKFCETFSTIGWCACLWGDDE